MKFDLVRALLTLFGIALGGVLVIWNQGAPALTNVDLGVAAFPDDYETDSPVAHVWQGAPDKLTRFKLSYAHEERAAEALHQGFKEYAKQVNFRREGDLFHWVPPKGCADRPKDCIYQFLREDSAPDLEPVVARLRLGLARREMSVKDAARWLLTFVQNIEYQLPDSNVPFGILPPALVLSWSWGDCDSKSLLLQHLLDELGIESILITSRAHKHALLAIQVTTSGKHFPHRGKLYAYAETTARSAPLGWIHPDLESPFDWKVASGPH